MKFFVFAAFCLLISCATADKGKSMKEGSIEYRISYGAGIDETTKSLMASRLSLKLKKDKLYLKMHGGLAEMKPEVIIDMKKQELLYPNYLDSTVLPKSISSLDYGKNFTESGQGETILGYTTTRYKARYNHNEYTIDAADGIPVNLSNTIIAEGFYLSAFNKIPLQVKIEEPGLSYSIRAESVQPGKVDDGVFEVPKGFKVRRP